MLSLKKKKKKPVYTSRVTPSDGPFAFVCKKDSQIFSVKEFKSMWEIAKMDSGMSYSGFTKRKGFSEDTYGETEIWAVDLIAKKLKISKTHTVLDAGMGIGNVVNTLAFTTGCCAAGIELNEEVAFTAHQVTASLTKQVESVHRYDTDKKVDANPTMRVKLLWGNFIAFEEHFKWFNFIYATDTLFDNSTRQKLFEIVAKKCSIGTRLLTFTHFDSRFKRDGKFYKDHVLQNYSDPEIITLEKSTSWKSSAQNFHIYKLIKNMGAET